MKRAQLSAAISRHLYLPACRLKGRNTTELRKCRAMLSEVTTNIHVSVCVHVHVCTGGGYTGHGAKVSCISQARSTSPSLPIRRFAEVPVLVASSMNTNLLCIYILCIYKHRQKHLYIDTYIRTYIHAHRHTYITYIT